ncbi:PocR ligand-binding domain-containing protein [Scatolibacter rhodanostii]|uniref:PocR ligand-binding domain-containing protein n=1 Tax=Scatolibacter rhodanostii TaxID=2014781 RepID=UPI000C06A7F1|nr:PocR ligand-binding domain-containing protein [Scatolibacter rhodanostii]
MNIRNFVDVAVLQEIQNDFSTATGLAAVAVDTEGNYLTKGSNFTEFCMKYTPEDSNVSKHSMKSDMKEINAYFSHTGLMRVSVDIVVEDEKVGTIIAGQVFTEKPNEDKFRAMARDIGVNEEDYIKLLNKIPVCSEKVIRAATDTLKTTINQFVNLAYIKKLNTKKIDIFDSELKISLENIEKIQAMTKDLQQVATMEKILALNASVEAAHAGVAGVGFSVVAEEIGNVSQKSALAYQEIFKLVDVVKDSIQKMGNVEV